MLQQLLNYKVIRKIGEGGMGEVYLASNPALGQMVAIKMLHKRYSENPLLREKFRQEAMMLSGLTHPNIVKFINYVDNDEGVFLIMEYVDGVTLDEYIHKKNGLIVEDRAKPMICELTDAFRHAHEQGIIHRDIKPGNILIDKDGHVKVLDFGIAQIMSEVDGEKDLGKGSGSPSYMSPEQVLGKPLDARSDIYSLGVVMYEMLTGRAPYDDKELTAMEIKHKVVHEPLPKMKEAYPYISDDSQKIVDKATRKNPEERFGSCAEMLNAIRGGKIGGGSSQKGSSGDKKWIIWVIAGLLFGALAVGGLMWWKPWESQSRTLDAEEEELVGDQDALLIDADDESDDDNVLLGANPTDNADKSKAGKKAGKSGKGAQKGGDGKKNKDKPEDPKSNVNKDPKDNLNKTKVGDMKMPNRPNAPKNQGGYGNQPKNKSLIEEKNSK